MERISYYDGDQGNYGNFMEDPDLVSDERIGFTSDGDLVVTVGNSQFDGVVKLYDGATGAFKKILLNATLTGYERLNTTYGGITFSEEEGGYSNYVYYRPSCMKFGPDGLMYVCDDIQHRLVRYNVTGGVAVFHSHTEMMSGAGSIVMNGVDFANNHVAQSPEDVVAYVDLTNYETGVNYIKRATNLVWESGSVYSVDSSKYSFRSFTVRGSNELYLNRYDGESYAIVMHVIDSLPKNNVTCFIGTYGSQQIDGMTCDHYFCTSDTCTTAQTYYFPLWDPYGMLIDAADRLYLTQYTEFTKPTVFNMSSRQWLGELGTTFGYLATPQNMALKAGANPSYSYMEMGTDSGDLNTGADGAISFSAGSPLNFTVHLRDSYNNTYAKVGTYLTVKLVGILVIGGENIDSMIDLTDHITDRGDGTVTVSYVPTRTTTQVYSVNNTMAYTDYVKSTDEYAEAMAAADDDGGVSLAALHDTYKFAVEVSMTEQDIPIKGSGFEVYIAPGPFHAGQSYVSPASVYTPAGEAVNMTITSRDANGNRINTGGHGGKFDLKLNGLNDTSRACPKTIVDNGDGTYSVATTFTTSGVYQLDFFYDGLPLRDSPVTFVVSAGDTVAAESLAYGDGLDDFGTNDGTKSETNKVHVTPKDKYGNTVTYNPTEYSSSDLNVSVVSYDLGNQKDKRKKVAVATTQVTYEQTGEYLVEYDFYQYKKKQRRRLRSVYVTIEYKGEPIVYYGSTDEALVSPYTYRVYRKEVTEERVVHLTTRVIFTMVSVIMVGLTCFFAYLVYRWSDENAIKFAQRPFLYVILFGLALAYASVPLLLDTEPTRVSCATQLYLVHGAFALVFTTIVAKMWRVMKISQAHVLKKVAITNTMLALRIGAVCLFMLVIATTWTALRDQAVVPRDHLSNKITRAHGVSWQYSTPGCIAGTPWWEVTLEVFEAGIVIYGLILSYHTRAIHEAFAEGSWLSMAVYNMAVCATISNLVRFLFDRTENYPVVLCIQATLLLVAATGVLFLLFIPKFCSILGNERLSINDFHRRYRMRSRSNGNKTTEITDTGTNFRNTTWRSSNQQVRRPTGAPARASARNPDMSDSPRSTSDEYTSTERSTSGERRSSKSPSLTATKSFRMPAKGGHQPQPPTKVSEASVESDTHNSTVPSLSSSEFEPEDVSRFTSPSLSQSPVQRDDAPPKTLLAPPSGRDVTAFNDSSMVANPVATSRSTMAHGTARHDEVDAAGADDDEINNRNTTHW